MLCPSAVSPRQPVGMLNSSSADSSCLGSSAAQFANLAEPVSVAGRVMLRRVMGKLAFLTLRDGSSDIQLYVDKSILEDACPGAFR